jgi:tetratricopeptide (TPR) repeat protein
MGLASLRGTGGTAGARDLFAALAEVLRGHEALEGQRWEEAVQAYRKVADSPVAPVELLGRTLARHLFAQLGRAHLGLERFEAAVQALEEAVALAPAGPEVYNDLGIARAGGGQLGIAVLAWEEGLARYPDFAPAHFNLGRALVAVGEFERAKAHWRRGLELMPGHPMAGQLRQFLSGE